MYNKIRGYTGVVQMANNREWKESLVSVQRFCRKYKSMFTISGAFTKYFVSVVQSVQNAEDPVISCKSGKYSSYNTTFPLNLENISLI